MIKEDRVTFEIAKLLKDKGFPQNTFEIDCNVCYKYNGKLCNNAKSMSGVDREISYMAPTIQMVMKWLREVHDLHIQVLPWRASEKETEKRWCCWVYKSYGMLRFEKYVNETLKSYEEAVEMAIRYILEHLI